jgi:acetyl esterase/lipase
MRLAHKGLLIGVAAAATLLALEVSPWPSALVIRLGFDIGGKRTDRALAPYVPAGLSAVLNESYDPADPGARLDVFYPSAKQSDNGLLTVVWIHGGAFVAGSKDQIASYAKILAASGYTVVGVDYSIAPERTYPTPLRQVNAALAFLAREAPRLHVDPNRFVLAGDSAGALIAAQVANLTTSPDYARLLNIEPALSSSQIAGVLLYCGPYDLAPAQQGGTPGWFGRTVLWSYSGRRHFANDSQLKTLAVVNYLTPRFPPSFISVGNADPLASHSRRLAAALTRLGVKVDTLFFPDDYSPALPHEYQFDLDTDAARLALSRSAEFLAGLR